MVNLKQLVNSPSIILDKNSSILSIGQLPDSVYYIVKGIVKSYKTIAENKIAVTLYFPGEYVGLDYINNNSVVEHSCVTATTCELIKLGKEKFLKVMSTNSQMLSDTLKYLSAKNDEIEMRMSNVKGKRTARNFAIILFRLNELKLKNLIPDILTCKDIADLIGTTPFYLYRLIQKFEDECVVSFKDRKLNVINCELLLQKIK